MSTGGKTMQDWGGGGGVGGGFKIRHGERALLESALVLRLFHS